MQARVFSAVFLLSSSSPAPRCHRLRRGPHRASPWALAVLGLLMAAGAPLLAQSLADSGFGMNNVNYSQGLIARVAPAQPGYPGTVTANNRYDRAVNDFGASWTRWVLWWHDVERYNNYGGAGDATGEPMCGDDLSQRLLPNDPQIRWTWGLTSPLPTGSTASRQYDEVLAADQARGLNTLIVLQGVPRCRQTVPSLPEVKPANLGESVFNNSAQGCSSGINPRNYWAYFVHQAVSRYGNQVRYWQVWNEPNLAWPGTPAEYARLVQVTYQAATCANSNVQLVAPGFSDERFRGSTEEQKIQSFYTALLQPSGDPTHPTFKDYLAAFGLHEYVSPWKTFVFARWTRDVLDDEQTPLWITESGVNSPVANVPELERNSYAIQHTAYFLALQNEYNLDRLFHFQLDDSADNTGLLTVDPNNPPPAGEERNPVYHTLERSMYDAFRDVVHEYLFDAAPRRVRGKYLLWTPDDSPGEPPPEVDYQRNTSGESYQAIYLDSPSHGKLTVLWNVTSSLVTADIPPFSPQTTGAFLVDRTGQIIQSIPTDPISGNYQIALAPYTHSAIAGPPLILVEPKGDCPSGRRGGGPFTCTPPDPPLPPTLYPDLTPTAIVYDSSQLAAGQPILLDSGVHNLGFVSSGSFAVRWRVDGQDIGALGGHDGVPARTVVLDGNSQLVWTAVAGTHTITFEVDAFGQITESKEFNNIKAVTLTVPEVDLPDLTPTPITFGSYFVEGQQVLVDSGVTNLGLVDSGTFNVQWLVDGQDIGAVGGHENVAAGTTLLDGNSQLIWTAEGGPHTLTFIVDFDNQLLEEDETNNEVSVEVDVAGAPHITNKLFTPRLVPGGLLYSHMLEVVDPNPTDLLTYDLTTGPSGMSLDSAGLLAWTAPTSGIGNVYPVSVEVSDGLFTDSHDFDVQTVNVLFYFTAPQPVGSTFLVYNRIDSTGTAPLYIYSVNLEGPDAGGEISVYEDQCTGRSLPPGTSCFIYYWIAPTSIGTKAATAVVSTNSFFNPTLYIGWTLNAIESTNAPLGEPAIAGDPGAAGPTGSCRGRGAACLGVEGGHGRP